MSSIKSSPPSSTVAGSDETVAELELVNTERAARGLWLVKVPKYLSQEWEKHDGEQVGKLVVDGGSIRLVSTIQPSSTGTEVPEADAIPTEHTFHMTDPAEPMAILSAQPDEPSPATTSSSSTTLNRPKKSSASRGLRMEGKVVKRCEVQPIITANYMKMKTKHFESQQPKATTLPMESMRNTYQAKKSAMPIEHANKLKAKKELGLRAVALDKDEVRNLVFKAFESHQYYRFNDLQKLLNQPAGVVKEVLMEVANYCTEPPHKFEWELKPQYRYYTSS